MKKLTRLMVVTSITTAILLGGFHTANITHASEIQIQEKSIVGLTSKATSKETKAKVRLIKTLGIPI